MTAVSDEVMFGDRGTVFLLRERPDLAGDFLISGEGPGFMGLAVAEKGLLWLDIEARAAGGHASRALRGETAVMRLAALLARLDAMNEIYATLPRELDGVSGGEGNLGPAALAQCGHDCGGHGAQPDGDARARQIDIRLPPGITAQDCEAMIRRRRRGESIAIDVVKSWDANWTALDNPLVIALAAAAEEVRGEPPAFVVRLPGSDARRWRDLGVPAGLLWPAADALGRHRRLRQRAGCRRLRQDLRPHQPRAVGGPLIRCRYTPLGSEGHRQVRALPRSSPRGPSR